MSPTNSRRLGAARAPIAIVGSLALVGAAAPASAVEPAVALADTEASASHTMGAAVPGLRPGIRASAAPRVRAAAEGEYAVQPGDTVSAIAARHGLRTNDVLALNGLGWSSIIRPGQVLRVAGSPAPAQAPAPAPAPAPPGGSYTVVAGDTISAIARRTGVSVEAVLSANGLSWSSIIVPGQHLTVPGTNPPAAVAPAAPAAPPAPPAPATATAYRVVAGDTISAIAQRHGVTVQAVLAANGLDSASIIYPGQTIAVPAAAAASAMVPAASASASTSTPLDAEQTANARVIIAVGRELGVSDRAIMIALGTAMQESWLRNLDFGDRDSVGLFQQRPSMGWGSREEARDPARATRVFFGGPADPNGARTRGLLDIPGWEAMAFAEAAQAVQISAYPDRYAQWEQPATAWLAALG